MINLSGQRRGKIGEVIVVKKLIELGFDVYDNIVDDKGIDLIIRIEKKDNIIHKDVQIKHSKHYVASDDWWFGISKSTFFPRSNLYFFFVLDENRIFVIPSLELKDFLKDMHADKKGNWKIIIKYKMNWVFIARKGKEPIRIDRYLNNFGLLPK